MLENLFYVENFLLCFNHQKLIYFQPIYLYDTNIIQIMSKISHIYFYDDDQSNIRAVKRRLGDKVTCVHIPRRVSMNLNLDAYQTNVGDYINGIPLAEIQRIGFDASGAPITDALFAFDWDETLSCLNGVSYPPVGPGQREVSFDDERALKFWPAGLEGYLASIMGGPERLAAIREMIDRILANNNRVVILTNNESASVYGRRGTRPLFIEMVQKLHPRLALLSSYTNYPTMEVDEETGEFAYASTKGKVLGDYIENGV
jgi:hypothetical protein